MSTRATSWAKRQRTGNPAAKAVLMAIADETASDGRSRPMSYADIGFEAEMSGETARRWVVRLEEKGLLTRFENAGKRNEFRLNMGGDAVRRGITDEDLKTAKREATPPQSDPGSPSTDSPGVTPPQTEGGTLSEEYIPPQSPSRGAVQEGASLDDFKRAYPCPTTKPAVLSQLWQALDADEREAAIAGAAGYAAHCDKRKRSPLDPVKFVRDQLWTEFAQLAPEHPTGAGVTVRRGSPEWAAWGVHYAILRPGAPPMRGFAENGNARACRTAFPPGGEALATFADADGEPDRGNWIFVEYDSQQWWAWNERVRKWTGADLVASSHGADERKGRLLPSEWPPRIPKPEEAAAE